MAMVAPRYYTADLVRALPEDGNRYEVVRGELLVTPAPRLWHQEIVRRLTVTLSAYLAREGVGHPFCAPADVSWGPDVLLQPDLFVVPLTQARTATWAGITDLLLAVEVLSPSSLRADRFTKRLEYQRQGVPCYWIVDLDAELVEVWSPMDRLPSIEREQLHWHPPGASAPFTLALRELFRPI